MSTGRLGTAALAFQETLERLDLPEEELGDDRVQAEIGRRGALLATAGLQWERHLGPLVTWQEVARLLGTVRTRQGVNDLARRGRLLALRAKGGQLAYPLFQLSEGRPLPALPRILDAFAGAHLDSWTIASWLVTPQDLLDDMTPVEWLRSGRSAELVVEAARRSSAPLER